MSYEKEIILNDKDCHAYIYRKWSTGEELKKLLDVAKENCTKVYKIQMHGKMIDQPRTNCSFSDEHIKSHKYNQVEGFKTEPFPEEVEILRSRIYDELDTYVDSALLNGYKDGTQYIGKHFDKNLKDDKQSIITLSLGASRRFILEWQDSKEKIETVLNDGDLLVMYGKTNKLLKHEIPKQLKVKEARYSYTFRVLSDETVRSIKSFKDKKPTIEEIKEKLK